MSLIKQLTSASLDDVDTDGNERLEKYISITAELYAFTKLSILDSKLESADRRVYSRYQYAYTGSATAMGTSLHFHYLLRRSFPWLNDGDTFTLTYRILGENKVQSESFVFFEDEWKPKKEE